MVEIRPKGVGDDFVEAIVLGFAGEGASPLLVAREIGSRQNSSDAVAKRNCFRNRHWAATEHRHFACAPNGHSVRCRFLSGVQLRWAHRLEVYVPIFDTPLRICRSRCGKGISIPASRSFSSIAKLRSLLNRLGRWLISALQTTSSKSIELSPNCFRKTLGAGSSRTCGLLRPAAISASLTFLTSLP